MVVAVLQSSMRLVSHMVAWSSFNMGKGNIFSIHSQYLHNTFYSSMVCKNGTSLNLKH